MILRDATAADAAGILAIWNTAIRETAITFTSTEKNNQDIVALISSGAGVSVLAKRGDIQGFASLSAFRPGSGYARTAEITIYLRAEAQKAGGGSDLMVAMKAKARGHGITRLIAGIGGENQGVTAFFAKHGFRTQGVLPGVGNKFGREMDLILMQCNLRE